ncbi:MAG: methyltransferase domain-containing protein [bacterium]|nr:methyltransferase domain-containing protein [bacterium]
MTRKPDQQTLPKGAFRSTYEWQRRQVPPMFRGYWERLAVKNGYYNHKFMADWADGFEDELLLEAGCGDNTTLGERKVPPKRLVGLDPLPTDMKKNPWPRHRVCGVIESLPFADECFAGVYSDSVFEHIDDPGRVCGEFFRVLKPGGRVLINTNSVFNPFMFPNKFMTIRQREWVKRKLKIISEGTYEAPYRINTRRRLIKYLSQAGYVNIRIYRWGVPSMYRPKWVLLLLLLMELLAEIPLFCGLKHRLMATCEKPK